MNASDIINELDFGLGYVTSSLDRDDFSTFVSLAEAQYKKNLKILNPELFTDESNILMHNYHALAIENHKVFWTKERRTIEENNLEQIKNLKFIRFLQNEFCDFKITNEDSTRSEEIYWRLVRPYEYDDVGPLHADSWFWDLHNGTIGGDLRRIKVWISLYNEPGINGLRLIEGSQKRKYAFRGELRDGKIKPIHDVSLELDQNLKIINTLPGDYIIFHDDLIHGGARGGNKTRASIEFTFLTKAK
jgi:hypothetical protein